MPKIVIRYNESKQKRLNHPFMKQLATDVELWKISDKESDGHGCYVGSISIESLSDLLENYLKKK